MHTQRVYSDLTMKGHIRTKQKCPECNGKFQEGKKGFFCPTCPTIPTRYFVDIYFGRRIKIYKDQSGQTLDSFDRTERLLTHIRWEIDNRRFNPDKYIKAKYEPYLMDNFTQKWLREQELRQRSAEISYSTLYKQKSLIENYIIPYFGRDDVRQIGTRGVKDFNTHLSSLKVKGDRLISPKYRQDIIGVLRQIFNDALEAEDIDRAQLPVFPTIVVPETGFEVLEEEEQDEILGKVPDYDRPIYHFIITYGIRPSEARALKKDAVIGNFDRVITRRTFSRNNRLRENPKEGKWRTISLIDETKKILRALPSSIIRFIFVNNWGRPYSQSYLNDTWNRACSEAGYRYIPLYHGTRHSLGTKLANEGLGKEMIATVLGHSNTKTTEKYTRYASDSLKPFFERKKAKKGTVPRLSPKEIKTG